VAFRLQIDYAAAVGWNRQSIQGEVKMKNNLLLLSVKLQNLLSREEGQDLIEYALVVALIAFAATAGMGTLATDINKAFTNIGTSLTAAI
jgi:pilus assembly protein Flp/PilA